MVRIGSVEEGELPALLSAAAVFVHPTWDDGFGYPPLEALACGTPVVVSDLAITRELLAPHALRVGSDDPRRWADAIDHALHDAAHRETVARVAPTWTSRFGVDRLGARLVHAYRRTLARSGSAPPPRARRQASSQHHVVDEVGPRGADRAQPHA